VLCKPALQLACGCCSSVAPCQLSSAQLSTAQHGTNLIHEAWWDATAHAGVVAQSSAGLGQQRGQECVMRRSRCWLGD